MIAYKPLKRLQLNYNRTTSARVSFCRIWQTLASYRVWDSYLSVWIHQKQRRRNIRSPTTTGSPRRAYPQGSPRSSCCLSLLWCDLKSDVPSKRHFPKNTPLSILQWFTHSSCSLCTARMKCNSLYIKKLISSAHEPNAGEMYTSLHPHHATTQKKGSLRLRHCTESITKCTFPSATQKTGSLHLFRGMGTGESDHFSFTTQTWGYLHLRRDFYRIPAKNNIQWNICGTICWIFYKSWTNFDDEIGVLGVQEADFCK